MFYQEKLLTLHLLSSKYYSSMYSNENIPGVLIGNGISGSSDPLDI